jgi:hypothetical protein
MCLRLDCEDCAALTETDILLFALNYLSYMRSLYHP